MGAADFSVVVKLLENIQLSEDEVAFLQGFLANVVQPGQCLRLMRRQPASGLALIAVAGGATAVVMPTACNGIAALPAGAASTP